MAFMPVAVHSHNLKIVSSHSICIEVQKCKRVRTGGFTRWQVRNGGLGWPCDLSSCSGTFLILIPVCPRSVRCKVQGRSSFLIVTTTAIRHDRCSVSCISWEAPQLCTEMEQSVSGLIDACRYASSERRKVRIAWLCCACRVRSAISNGSRSILQEGGDLICALCRILSLCIFSFAQFTSRARFQRHHFRQATLVVYLRKEHLIDLGNRAVPGLPRHAIRQ